ncbi:MAG: galactokinase [Bdellovibrionaceae bacterium]|nr:galactokinase [Pseudobdellovibrionaceae bacterium]
MKIEVRSPTRVDLAGGTLDLWPLYNFVGSAKTVNVAIDIWTQAEIEETGDGSIELISKDLNLDKKYINLQEALKDTDPKLSLLQKHLAYWKPKVGFRLTTSSQSPVGGGLGGSSSLTISILKAFEKLTREEFRDSHGRVHVAHNIEAQVLNTPTGTQDYYPADLGGLNLIHYDASGIHLQTLPVENTPFAEQFLLVNTGKAHHSGLNNFEVMTRAVHKDPTTLKALHDIKVIADEMSIACLTKGWDRLPELFRREYEARVRLAPAFTSPEIEKLSDVSLKAGALAVKICGAGGGGCVMVWCPPGGRTGVAAACEKAGFQVLAARTVAPLR